jgi:hypothetical protein
LNDKSWDVLHFVSGLTEFDGHLQNLDAK